MLNKTTSKKIQVGKTYRLENFGKSYLLGYIFVKSINNGIADCTYIYGGKRTDFKSTIATTIDNVRGEYIEAFSRGKNHELLFLVTYSDCVCE